jgi:hypothetical protein
VEFRGTDLCLIRVIIRRGRSVRYTFLL